MAWLIGEEGRELEGEWRAIKPRSKVNTIFWDYKEGHLYILHIHIPKTLFSFTKQPGQQDAGRLVIPRIFMVEDRRCFCYLRGG